MGAHRGVAFVPIGTNRLYILEYAEGGREYRPGRRAPRSRHGDCDSRRSAVAL